jgi:cell division protein FtsB
MGALSRLKGARMGAAGGELLGRLFVVALIPIVLYSLGVVADKFVQTYRLRQEAAVVRAEIEAERAENLRLQRELAFARSDQGLEETARRHLNLVRSGDQAVILGGLPTPTPVASTPAQAPLADRHPSDGLLEWVSRLLGRSER